MHYYSSGSNMRQLRPTVYRAWLSQCREIVRHLHEQGVLRAEMKDSQGMQTLKICRESEVHGYACIPRLHACIQFISSSMIPKPLERGGCWGQRRATKDMSVPSSATIGSALALPWVATPEKWTDAMRN